MKLSNLFAKHPNEVGMSYFQHLCFALMLARKMLLAMVASIVHSVFPFLFTTYTSSTIKELHTLFSTRLKNNNP